MSFCDRKCDLLDCKKRSPLWTMLTICEATLLSKVETLGKTANDAVLKIDTVNHDSNEDDDTSDDESCGSNDEVECLCENEQPHEPEDAHILFQRIQLWQKPWISRQ